MKTTTESDIPQLFRQFSGNSANYQELTRAAAARASQARWPLLSAVELEQGDIPAVIDPETGLPVLETAPRQAKPAADDAAAVPFAVLTEIIPDTPLTAVEILAQANDEGVKLSKDELLALVDVEANYPLEMPVPVIVPGTNTIFMPPAPFSARHFAQVERALAARREAATGDSPVQAEVAAAPLADIPAQAEVAEATLPADVVAEPLPATTTAPPDLAVDTLAALSAELAAAQRQEAAAPVAAVVKAETPPATPQAPPAAMEAAVSTPAPELVDTALPTQVAPTIAAPSLPVSPAPAQTPAVMAQAAPAKPVSTPISQPVATPPQAKAAAPSSLRAYAPSTAASQPLAAASNASPVKHAGLQPLFERLAAPEETASPVKSLFSRLLQS